MDLIGTQLQNRKQLKALKVPYIAFDQMIPFGIAPTGTIGGAGADNNLLTLGTAMLLVHPDLYLYFPANAVASGSAAGFYYCSMSSTTLGRVYQDRFLSAVDETPEVPATPLAAVGYASATAYTGVAGSVNNAMRLVVPANALGDKGSILLYIQQLANSSGNNKGMSVNFGNTYVAGSGSMSTVVHSRGIAVIQNIGRPDAQFLTYNQLSNTTTLGGAPSAVNTRQDVQIVINLINGVATDWTICQLVKGQLNPG